MHYLAGRLMWLCVLAALAVTASIRLVRAADDKTYSAAMCDLHLPGGETIRSDYGALLNYYFDEVHADCPIVRDNITNTNGIKAVYVRAKDEQPQLGNIMCILSVRSMYGTDFEWNTVEQQGWWQGSLYLDLDTSYWGGYYNLWCSFPFESVFYGYRVIEYD